MSTCCLVIITFRPTTGGDVVIRKTDGRLSLRPAIVEYRTVAEKHIKNKIQYKRENDYVGMVKFVVSWVLFWYLFNACIMKEQCFLADRTNGRACCVCLSNVKYCG